MCFSFRIQVSIDCCYIEVQFISEYLYTLLAIAKFFDSIVLENLNLKISNEKIF